MPYRDTTTGIKFEKQIKIKKEGIDLSQWELGKYFKNVLGIPLNSVVPIQYRPDEAYFNKDTGEFCVYEKKTQHKNGSADEKLGACGFKIKEYEKIGKALGAKTVTYTFILDDWFKKDRYKTLLEYVRSLDGCDYIFKEDIDAT